MRIPPFLYSSRFISTKTESMHNRLGSRKYLGAILLFVLAASASVLGQATVYNAVPNVLAPNYPSVGFQATQSSELGDFVHLTGSSRLLKSVTITMSDWALEATAGNVTYCSNNPGTCDSTGFLHPFTINIYGTPTGTVGTRHVASPLATVTETKLVPWRPAADPTCSGGTAWRASDGNCYNGFAFNLTFDMSALNVTLPDDVVVGIAYNTQTYGTSPIGVDGPYNSLNVSVIGDPSTGADDNSDNIFWNTATAGWYADNGASGVGIFREDSNWTPYGTVPIKITTGVEFVVDDNSACPNANYTTISSAVAAASAGDTIEVCSGTYHEDVVVNKPLIIRGAGYTSTFVNGVPGGDVGTFRVSASNVEISGFTITRDGNNPTDWNNSALNSAGVALIGQSISGMVLHDNYIYGNRTGIDINNSNGHTVRNNVIENNHTGIILRNQTDNLIVTENSIVNNRTVGIVFLDASSGSNVPLQQALGSSFTNNNISGNWYGQVVDRQSGGSLPAPGTTNLKNFRFNWFGSANPVVTTANSAELSYSVLIPPAFGGTAMAPGGQPDIAGPASANFQFLPILSDGTDTNVETTPGRGTFGFQGGASIIQVTQNNLNGWVMEQVGGSTAGFATGPLTPPIGLGSASFDVGSDGDDYAMFRTQAFAGVPLSDITSISYSTFSASGGTNQQAPVFSIRVDFDNDGIADDVLYFEPVYQNGTYGGDPVPNQCVGNPTCVSYGQWQTWNAFTGGYWANSITPGGPPLTTLASYIEDHPGARVASDGTGSIRIFAGGGSGAWDDYLGNTDNLTIGVNGLTATYDFGPSVPSLTVNQASGQSDPTGPSGSIHFTAAFSEPVSGFDNSDIILSGPGSAGVTVSVTGGPSTYDIEVSGMTANGEVIASVGAGAAQGQTSGVLSTASTSTDNSVYFVATCNAVSIPTTITSLTGVQVVVPIDVNDLTGRSAFGYDTTINYDPAVLSYVGIEQVGTISSGLTIVPNWANPGTLSISAFSTNNPALTGSGTLLNVRFQVIGSISGTASPITFSNFVFNEGNPCSTTANGAITVISGSLSGTVTYVNGSPTTPGVPNVNMAGTGTGGNVSATTDGLGNYSMSGFGAGGYTVTPSKAPLPLGSLNSAITNVDSTRIAQHNVGLITLNANQIIAGDVTGNGTVSNLDSTYIAQWKVGTINPGTTGTWIFQPISRSYPNLNASISGENYNAILKGDVTGNWNPAEAPNFAPAERPSKDAVIVQVGDVKAVSGSGVTVPIDVTDLTSKGVTGYEFEINYDPKLLEPADVVADVAGTISEGRAVVSNSPEEGRVLVVVYGIFPIEGKGRLLNLHFSTIGKSNTETPITLRNLTLNENEVESYPVSGSIHFVQNSDGPVIRGRVISYSGDAVSSARVSITDTRGRSYSVKSNSFGVFEFGNLMPGEVYTINVASKDHRFTPRTVVAVDGAIDLVVMSQ